jgi:hypothetical protein
MVDLDHLTYGPGDALEIGKRQIFTLQRIDKTRLISIPEYSIYSLASISCLEKIKNVIGGARNGDTE